jgi:hypothetical protein
MKRSGDRVIGDAVPGKKTGALAREIFRRVARTILAIANEIFDESAYERFLYRTGMARSGASYRAFTRERDAAILKKPRCC